MNDFEKYKIKIESVNLHLNNKVSMNIVNDVLKDDLSNTKINADLYLKSLNKSELNAIKSEITDLNEFLSEINMPGEYGLVDVEINEFENEEVDEL